VWSGGAPVIIGQRGSGTLMGLALLAGITILGSSAVFVTMGLVEASRVQVAANQAALAASDVSRGVVPGHPCRMASHLVNAAGYRVGRCEVGGGEARVMVSTVWWSMPVEKGARAGPTPHPVFDGDR
jgi:secretion/DNA translocation related TadE-like protein